MPRYWKVLNADGSSCHGGTFTYDLPKRGKPGKWTPRIPDLVACRRGYHLCRDADLIHWCNGATIWAAEARGRIITHDNKVVCESVRLMAPTPWDAVTARLFAVECAVDVLHLNNDPRVSDCLVTAYRYALGEATKDELEAAWATVWAAEAAGATRAAAREAAGEAVWEAAREAARAAARAMVWEAAWEAAGEAAWATAGAKQTARLLWWLGASPEYPQP